MLWIVIGGMVFVFALGAIWLGGWFLGATLITKTALSSGVLLIAGLTVLIAFIVRLRRAARIERGLMEQGARQIANAGADRRGELQTLQTQVAKAIATLKQSRLGSRGGATALYALPWYVIVGPPGAGKTTAIRHSGLSFPLDQSAAYRGTGGTRNCDWWFSNDAVILDTAGRYATSVDDQPEWLAFLDLLRKYRKRSRSTGSSSPSRSRTSRAGQTSRSPGSRGSYARASTR